VPGAAGEAAAGAGVRRVGRAGARAHGARQAAGVRDLRAAQQARRTPRPRARADPAPRTMSPSDPRASRAAPSLPRRRWRSSACRAAIWRASWTCAGPTRTPTRARRRARSAGTPTHTARRAAPGRPAACVAGPRHVTWQPHGVTKCGEATTGICACVRRASTTPSCRLALSYASCMACAQLQQLPRGCSGPTGCRGGHDRPSIQLFKRRSAHGRAACIPAQKLVTRARLRLRLRGAGGGARGRRAARSRQARAADGAARPGQRGARQRLCAILSRCGRPPRPQRSARAHWCTVVTAGGAPPASAAISAQHAGQL